MFIPTGFLLGGKYNILLDAKNSDNINEKISNLKNDLNFFANEQKIGGKFEFQFKFHLNLKLNLWSQTLEPKFH